jgi:hypothetical protein
MERAQARMAHYANQSRRDVRYAVGDLVLLKSNHLRFKARGARKLPLPQVRGAFQGAGLSLKAGRSASTLKFQCGAAS